MNVAVEIERIGAEIKTRVERIKWLKKHRAKLNELPNGRFYDESLDFDNMEHAQVVKIIRTLGGKWAKSAPTGIKLGTANYESDFESLKIRCWQGALPPSCKIIEVEEYVPEQIIPAGVRKVLKTVCHPEVGAVIASAAERGQAQASQNP